MNTNVKYNNLIDYFKKLGRVAIAFSSGVDSTFMLKTAKEAVGCENVVAITVKSFSVPKREIAEAKTFCEQEGVKQVIIEINELEIEGFKQNPPNRCYICKRNLFEKIIETAKQNDFDYVCEGSNADDKGDYRPGMQAVKELGVLSPLSILDFTKDDIRQLSKKLGLPTWKKQSFSCLSTRFVYGEEITEEKLLMLEKAEQYLIDLGFQQLRVRVHGDVARIEVQPKDIQTIIDNREAIYSKFNAIGFKYVALDLLGYRTGSMNEVLDI